MGPLGSDEVMRVGAVMNGVSALIKEVPERTLPLPSCEDATRNQPSMNQDLGPLWTPNLLPP